jgi:hypothetical protein
MRSVLHRCAALAALALAACSGDATRGTLAPPAPTAPPAPLGLYEITVTGIGSQEPRSSVAPARTAGGARATLTTAGAGIVFEQVSSSSFTEGARGAGGQRYISFTYRVRNGTGVALNNLTLLAVSRTGTISGTPISSIKRFDGTSADPAIATYVAPTGEVALRSDLVTMGALDPDVIQVFQESEVAAITPPADVSSIFPYGYVVRSANPAATSRALPAATSANQYDGVMTLSLRLPLQATSTADVFSLTLQILAVEDNETRLTESLPRRWAPPPSPCWRGARRRARTWRTTPGSARSAPCAPRGRRPRPWRSSPRRRGTRGWRCCAPARARAPAGRTSASARPRAPRWARRTR